MANSHWVNIREQYILLKKDFATHGIQNPDNIRDLIARKFINNPDWERAISLNIFNPQDVYAPAPVTWNNWHKVNSIVTLKAQQGTPLTVQDLLDWNSSALINTVSPFLKIGVLKSGKNYGKNLEEKNALTTDEINNLLNITFSKPSIRLKWVDLICREQFPTNYTLNQSHRSCKRISFWSKYLKNFSGFWSKTFDDINHMDLKKNDYWFWYACWPREKNAQFENKRCGMIEYPHPKFIKNELRHIVVEINNYFRLLGVNANTPPHVFAASIQQKLVALHPFNKGNGRLSRWVMDYILQRNKLPFILLADMDKDLTIGANDIPNLAINGMNKYLSIMQHCLTQYKTGRVEELCQEIK